MHSVTRRSILLLGGAVGVAALVSPAEASTLSGSRHANSAIGTRADFAGAARSAVTAIAPDGRFRLTLLDILDLGPAEQFDPQQNFNLIFQAGRAGTVPDGIYRLGSARFPATTLLLNRTGPTHGRQLQALVNRSVRTPG